MAKKSTSTGATVTITKAGAGAAAAPNGDMVSQLLAADKPAAAAPAPVVALRGGIAVQAVKLTDKKYATKAEHNLGWWTTITTQAAQGPASVKSLVEAKVPAHFIGYCVRRGYLGEAKLAS